VADASAINTLVSIITVQVTDDTALSDTADVTITLDDRLFSNGFEGGSQ
jgi:uncharacterized protein YjiK